MISAKNTSTRVPSVEKRGNKLLVLWLYHYNHTQFPYPKTGITIKWKPERKYLLSNRLILSQAYLWDINAVDFYPPRRDSRIEQIKTTLKLIPSQLYTFSKPFLSVKEQGEFSVGGVV